MTILGKNFGATGWYTCIQTGRRMTSVRERHVNELSEWLLELSGDGPS